MDLLEVRIGLLAREHRRDLDRDLLEAERRLEGALVRRVEPVDPRLLVLLHAADPGERTLQRSIHPRGTVTEAQRLGLHAVHEDDTDARVRIVVELREWRAHEVMPVELLLVERDAALLHDVESHARVRKQSAQPAQRPHDSGARNRPHRGNRHRA